MSPGGDSSDRRVQIAAALIGAAGAIIAALILADPFGGGKPATGHIAFPQHGQRVARAFTVDGSLARVPGDRHVWLVVQIGNLVYPKEPEIPRSDRHFAQQVVEGGSPPGGRFSVALLTVGDDGQHSIEVWLGRVRRNEGPPALERIPGSVKLDVVQDLQLR